MLDFTFLLTVLIIFIGSLLAAWLRARRRDRCLADFEEYEVTIEKLDGNIVWGRLELSATGFELHYRDNIQDDEHLESSYVVYNEEYADIQAIFRYADQLSEKQKKERDGDVRRSFNPSPMRALGRKLSNFMRTATESLNEAVGLLIGRVRKPAGNLIDDTSETYLKKLGSNVIGHMSGSYDPLLERFIGCKVVVEVVEEDAVHEHVGIFKNYSADFLQLLDVQFPHRQSLKVKRDKKSGKFGVVARVEGQVIEVHNQGSQPVLIQSLHVGDKEQLINVVVDCDDKVAVHPKHEFTKADLTVRIVRELDMIVPRKHCVIRHRAGEFHDEGLIERVFDLGIALASAEERLNVRETRLRDMLEQDRYDALAAANLGGLLIQKRAYDEAATWLRHALTMRYSLPDNGRRAQMQLFELRKRIKRQAARDSRVAVIELDEEDDDEEKEPLERPG